MDPTATTIFVKTQDDELPDAVPRYKLCSVPEPVLKQVHGLSVTSNVDDPQRA
jgi:hypothetical protein